MVHMGVWSGPFYLENLNKNIARNADGNLSAGLKIMFDASRCSDVYKNGVTEARPRNLAVRFIIKY